MTSMNSGTLVTCVGGKANVVDRSQSRLLVVQTAKHACMFAFRWLCVVQQIKPPDNKDHCVHTVRRDAEEV